jgi:hypothetical protein
MHSVDAHDLGSGLDFHSASWQKTGHFVCQVNDKRTKAPGTSRGLCDSLESGKVKQLLTVRAQGWHVKLDFCIVNPTASPHHLIRVAPSHLQWYSSFNSKLPHRLETIREESRTFGLIRPYRPTVPHTDRSRQPQTRHRRAIRGPGGHLRRGGHL